MSSVPVGNNKHVRRRLLLLASVFAVPMVAAYVLYYSGWRPAGGQAHGELVTPARPVTDIELRTVGGEATRIGDLRRRWVLLYFGSSDCAAACERALYNMRQVIAAQGREAHRLRATMIVTDTRAIEALRARLTPYPDMLVLTGTREQIARLAREFELPAGGALAGGHRLYVLDPLGNFMMSYPADADPAGMHKDIKRLLRYSQVG